MRVEFHDLKEDTSNIRFVVIQAKYQGEWIFVRHKERTTWEIPGGRIEPNETIDEAAKRELWEETGSTKFELKSICDYSVNRDGESSFGRLYVAEVEAFEALPNHEIGEISFNHELPSNLTYEEIQPFLYEKVCDTIEM